MPGLTPSTFKNDLSGPWQTLSLSWQPGVNPCTTGGPCGLVCFVILCTWVFSPVKMGIPRISINNAARYGAQGQVLGREKQR